MLTPVSKKKFWGSGLVLLGLVAVWAVVREKAARDHAFEVTTKREIPIYHQLSFHFDDRNALGYCRPCVAKAQDVGEQRVKDAVRDLTGK